MVYSAQTDHRTKFDSTVPGVVRFRQQSGKRFNN